MNASGVNQYLSPARSAATACAYSCPYSTERSGRMFPFISMQTNLSTQEILEMYAKRWSIEVFFRNCKQKLAFDKCQLRKQRGIERMWLILSLVHFLCCTLPDYRGAFEKGFAYFRECLLQA